VPAEGVIVMAVNGVAEVIYGVEDLDLCVRFYEEFGLLKEHSDGSEAVFRVPEGSIVRLRRHDDPRLPMPFGERIGVRETIWGVESEDELQRLNDDLRSDRAVTVDADGTSHLRDDQQLPIGLKVFLRSPAEAAAEPVNSAGRIERWNKHRVWYDRAYPKLIHHVVFGVPDHVAGMDFYVRRLGFQITDVARGRGLFARAGGRHDHHNIFFMKSETPHFVHISFGVDNIDELAAGANHLARHGWTSPMGLGRHRISSTLFYYVAGPCGGETEYSADMDYLDENWQPRIWEPKFGNFLWVAAMPPSLQTLPEPGMELWEPEAGVT
jgi:catechol-2,3-dioxygenase